MEGPGFAAEEAEWYERFMRIFYAPKSSFAAVVGRETAWDWLLPLLFTCLLSLSCYYLTIDVVSDLDTPAVREKLSAMDEAQRQQYAKSVDMLRAQGWTMVPVGLFTSLVMVSGLLMGISRFVFQGELSFREALIIKAYATLIVCPEWIVRALLILATDSPFVYLGPGMLLGEATATTFLGRMLVGINFFDLWQVGVMGCGLSAMSGVKVQRTTLALAALWLMWLVGGALLETMAVQVAPAEL